MTETAQACGAAREGVGRAWRPAVGGTSGALGPRLSVWAARSGGVAQIRASARAVDRSSNEIRSQDPVSGQQNARRLLSGRPLCESRKRSATYPQDPPIEGLATFWGPLEVGDSCEVPGHLYTSLS